MIDSQVHTSTTRYFAAFVTNRYISAQAAEIWFISARVTFRPFKFIQSKTHMWLPISP